MSSKNRGANWTPAVGKRVKHKRSSRHSVTQTLHPKIPSYSYTYRDTRHSVPQTLSHSEFHTEYTWHFFSQTFGTSKTLNNSDTQILRKTAIEHFITKILSQPTLHIDTRHSVTQILRYLN
jgi:hypothetical protein